ncbi:MAG TPA: methyl-accepting chemotaxis protein [Longimicrobium sp.]|nr:methyl-accepting chemotaxis protein [Longimicrobium sp.]
MSPLSDAAPAAAVVRHVGPADGATSESLLHAGYRAADRLLRRLLLAHLLLVLALAPLRDTWTEALLWGVPVIGLGWLVAWRWEGRPAARFAIAAALLTVSALIIHQTGGMIEMHFHIFAILAFLLLYRDWRVPVAGAAVVAVHHAVFNALQTAGTGVMVFQHHTGWGIVAVHAAWVVFEVAILVYMARLLAGETRSADALVRMATRMGEGDLATRADEGAGAVGDAVRAVNRGTGRLAGAVSGVRRRATEVADVAHNFTAVADHVTGAADEAARALGEVSYGTQEQAAGTQRMAETLGGMARSIGGIARRSQGVAGATERAVQVARDGTRVIGDAVGRLQAIRDTVVAAAGQIAELGARSDQVERITRVIDDMAAQTNLLALNTAIEAARAGEHGRGFAVVAEEVRKLATRSGEAAREAADIIRDVQALTARAVQSMERGTAEVNAGASLAGDAETALRELVGTVEQTVRDVAAISGEAEGMARTSRTALATAGVDPAAVEAGAHDALDPLVRLSRANADAAESAAAAVEEINAAMQEMSASAEELAQIAGELQAEVQRFRTGEDDGPAAEPGVPVSIPRLVDLPATQAAAA